MPPAIEHRSTVYKGGSCINMARVADQTGTLITRAAIATAAYTVALIDPADENADTPVEHHAAVALTVADVIYNSLQTGGLWDADATGYNFRHVLDVRTHQAFTLAGHEYRVTYTLTPAAADGQPIILRYRLEAV